MCVPLRQLSSRQYSTAELIWQGLHVHVSLLSYLVNHAQPDGVSGKVSPSRDLVPSSRQVKPSKRAGHASVSFCCWSRELESAPQ